jgi:glycosyltransferase involved in cell wall biosynthesis
MLSSHQSKGDKSARNVDILVAIRRLESHNGITVYLQRLAKHLDARSTEFDLMLGELKRAPGTERAVEELIGSARRVTICKELEYKNAVHKLSWGFLGRLAQYCMARFRVPVVVSTHSFDAFLVCAVLARIRKNVHVVHTLHLSMKPSRIRIFHSLLGKLFIRGNPRVYFHAISSEIEHSLIAECGIQPDQVRKIFHGVDPSIFRPPSKEERMEARKHLGVGSTSCCISIVARVNAQKGHDFLINALLKIPNAAQRFIVLAVGRGSPEWLEKLANDSGFASIIKPLGQADPLQALWASDLFVLPSRWEGFALASVEAMACGLPVIRTNTAGAVDQIEEGQNGFILPLENTDVLADALAQKIDDISSSDSLRLRLGKASRERAVSMFNLDALLEEKRLFLLSAANGTRG